MGQAGLALGLILVSLAKYMPRCRLALLIAAAGFPACARGPEPFREAGPDQETASGLRFDVSGRGPAVVLIHGALLDRRQWHPQWPLTGRFTIIRYDTRWHGRSVGARAPFHPADDLAEVLDAAGVHRASLIGLSNGAAIALEFALANPDRVDRLVLVSPGLGGYQPVERPAFWGPLIDALKAGRPDEAADLLARSPVMAVAPHDTGWVRAMVRQQAGVFRGDPTLERRASPPAIRRLGEIRAPTLVVTGDRDLRDTQLTADTIVAGVRLARRMRLPGEGHLLTISAAAQFNRLVTGFLKGRRSEAPHR